MLDLAYYRLNRSARNPIVLDLAYYRLNRSAMTEQFASTDHLGANKFIEVYIMFVLKIKNVLLKMMDCALEMVDFALKLLDFAFKRRWHGRVVPSWWSRRLNGLRFAFKIMNFVVKMIDFVFKMLDYASQMMDYA